MGDQSMFTVLITGGGGIGYVIILLSVVMVALAIKAFIEIRRTTILPEVPRSQIQSFFESRQYKDAIEMAGGEPSFFSYIVHAALAEAPHGYPAMERAMEEAAEERTTMMLRSIEWLNLIGNIGPMLGLMGTVWGMIGAFFSIVAKKGIPNPADLAGDIGVALVTTLLGLTVAIPALGIYGIMRNRIDALTSEAITSSQNLISSFRPGAKKVPE